MRQVTKNRLLYQIQMLESKKTGGQITDLVIDRQILKIKVSLHPEKYRTRIEFLKTKRTGDFITDLDLETEILELDQLVYPEKYHSKIKYSYVPTLSTSDTEVIEFKSNWK